MSMRNTRNLIQTEGGRTIKQADKGSTLAFRLVDEKRNDVQGINGSSAGIALYDKLNNKKWETRATVKDSQVSFTLPGNLSTGIYDLDVTVGNMVFPSDRGTKIEIVEGFVVTTGSKLATDLIIDVDSLAKKADLDKKVDKVSGKGLSTYDYNSTAKNKVDNIPLDPKYTDTTYSAGTGLVLSGTTFSLANTVAYKSDIPSLIPYAKKTDLPDLSPYALQSDVDNKVDKVTGKGLSSNDFTNSHKAKVDDIPSNPKYTDTNTTYKAGDGLSLSGTTFSVSNTIARKTDLPSLEGYAKLSDIPDIDTKLGTIDLTKYATKADLNDYAKKSDIPKIDTIAGSIDLSSYVTKSELDKLNVSGYTKKEIDDLTGVYFLSLESKVDKEEFKGLSTNDFTDDYKNKLDRLTNVDLSNYALKTDLSNKVDKVAGKGLSTYDYTDTDKKKVQSIPTNPKYTDTTYTVGSGLKLTGTRFDIDTNVIATKNDLKGLGTGSNLTAGTGITISSDNVISTSSSIALKSDIPKLDDYARLDQIPSNGARIYDNDSIDYEEAQVGKDWFLRNDGLMGPISSIDRDAKSLRFNTRFTLNYPFARKKDIPDVSGYALKTDLNNKVDKANGKGLSSNDFTSTEKEKLSRMFEPEEILVYNGTSVIQKIYMINGVIPNGTRVDKNATKVDLPWGRVTHIPQYLFYETNVTSVNLHGVSTIGESAFYDSKLSGTLTIPLSVAFMGQSCFYNNNIEEIEYFSSASIPWEAFKGNMINKLTIHEGLSYIGYMAFQYNKLTEVDIPKSVKHVDNNAFDRNPLHTVKISRYTSFEPNSFPSTARIIYKD